MAQSDTTADVRAEDALIRRMREFFVAEGGAAATDHILRRFRNDRYLVSRGDEGRLLFRQMLRAIAKCADGVWTLKEEHW